MPFPVRIRFVYLLAVSPAPEAGFSRAEVVFSLRLAGHRLRRFLRIRR